MHIRRRWFLAGLLLFTGCREKPSTCRPESFDFEEWTFHHELLDQAVEEANAVLDPSFDLRLTTRYVKAETGHGSVCTMPVAGTFVADSDTAMTVGPHCVFVNHNWKSQVGGFFGADDATSLNVETVDALAIVLLHELGHLQPEGLTNDPAISTLLNSLGQEQSEEIRADAFAARQIGTLLTRKYDSHRQFPFTVLTTLSKISFNLQADRNLNHFAADALGEPKLFREPPNAHPNLEMRFLVIGYLAHPDPVALDLLEHFLAARNHTESGILFQR